MTRTALRRYFTASQVWHLWETPPAGTPPAGTPPAGSPPAGTPPAGTPPAGSPPAATSTGTAPAGTKPKFTYDDDRSKWIPPHRLKEETDARTREQQRAATLEAERDTYRKQAQALAGVTPKDPDTLEVEKIREAFFALPGMGHFKELTAERMAKLLDMVDKQGSIESAVQHQWDTLAHNTYQSLDRQYLELIGADPNDKEALPPAAMQYLHLSFAAFVRSNVEEYKPRYDRSDPTLIDEFLDTLNKGVFEPVRRQATAGAVNRVRPVPRPGSSAPVRADGPPKIDFGNMQEAEDAAVARLKEAGLLHER